MKAALGESNVVEIVDYDAVWISLYPNDSARKVSVELDSNGRVAHVRVEDPASTAQLGGALRMGDDLAAVERFNGAPLPLDGNELQSFEVATDPDSLCRYRVNVRADAPSDRASFRVSALDISRVAQ